MRASGALFERRTRAELERAGLRTLDANYTTRLGELDLVMREGATIVFVEVRYRRRAGHGDAAASVTATKRGKLVRTAALWLAAHPEHADRTCRFDVVTWDGPAEAPCPHWLRGAFDAD